MKLVDKELTKRIHAILFFCKNVKYPYLVKMFKLLYFLDFIHFKQAGRPVTDLEYYTFEMGPVPLKFYNEIKTETVPDEIGGCVEIFAEKDEITQRDKWIKFHPKKSPDLKVFTKREQQILKDLAFMFKETKGEDMSEVSHLKNQPWDITKKSVGMRKRIDFFLSLKDENALVNLETAKERVDSLKEMKELFS